ncbi:MAG: type IV pilus assembly protein PilM [Armatimonadetes bacterium]|nr:type IV pilus assembly protein PilM [Armatimonadota bacterium]
MALFGRKAKDATLDPPVSGADNGAAVETDAPPAKGAKRVKAAREPKAVKNKLVKNGVAVGLNIGNQFIKAVEVTSKNGELAVTGMGVVPTPPESYTNGNVLSVSALTGAIKDLWRVAGIKSKVAVTSVAGTGALVVRVIEVPKMTDGELSDNMKVDADRYIPFPPSEVVMDFKALRDLPSDPDAPNMEVLLAAAQREVIDLHIRVVQSAKLDPRAIDVEPIAATRALQLEKRGTAEMMDYNEVTGVINLGATGAEISILRGDIVVFTRAVPNGGNSVTQAIADGLGLPFADAETVKIGSADALAPAGYGAAPAADDFGFGAAAGGEDFDFGGEEFSGGDLNTAFNDISANPTAAAPSDDPFDLDFFNQGPKNNEPGAGHAQKEGEPPADNSAPAFSFDFGDPAPATPPTDPAPPADAPPAPSGLDFSFGEDEPATPAASPTPAAPPAPPTFNFGGSDDFNTEYLPAIGEDQPPTTLVSAAPSPANTARLDDTPTAPATPPPSAPPASQGFSTSMPSAFDFDNFDLPTSQPTGAAPVSSPPAAETAPVAFGFDAPDVAPTAAAPAGLSFETEPTPAPLTPAAPPTPAGAGEFDLDAIFGAPAASSSTAAAPAPGEMGALDATIIPNPNQGAVDAGDFDLSAIGTDVEDDFGLGAPASGDDFAAFGAGLGAAGASTDAATLYSLIYPPLEELSNEVRRSLEFHLGRYPDATISRLVLLGGGAKLRNLDKFFIQMLGVPTTVANPFAHIAVQTPKLAPDYATENGPTCAVALGLALRDFVD